MDSTPQYSRQTAISWYQNQLSKYNLRPIKNQKTINIVEVLKASQLNGGTHLGTRQRDACYAFDSVRYNTVLMDTSIRHDGCVNSAKWSYETDYDILVTGSDDRTVKLWKYENGAPMKLIDTIQTFHRSNIFNAEICPNDRNKIVSCAADGAVILHDLTNKYDQTNLLQSDSLIHSFIFDCDNSNILYVAEDAGSISVVDIRVKSRVNALYSNKVAKKAILQSSVLGNANIFFAESDTYLVYAVDLRFSPSEGGAFSYITSYSPANPTPSFGSKVPALSFKATNEVLSSNYASCKDKVSVSGMAISRDCKTLLVNYQGDSIYTFPIDGYDNEKDVGANGIYGGHINASTFLKNVQFYGPNDEYILTGSDNGYLWIYETEAGRIENKMENERDVVVVNVLYADKSVCNGSAVHLHDPCFVTYGIGKTCRMFGFGLPGDKKTQLSRLNTLPVTMINAVGLGRGECFKSTLSRYVYDCDQFMQSTRAIMNKFEIEACDEGNGTFLKSSPYFPSNYEDDLSEVCSKDYLNEELKGDLASFVREHFYSHKYISRCGDETLIKDIMNISGTSLPLKSNDGNPVKIVTDVYGIGPEILGKQVLVTMVASESKERGNDAFQRKQYRSALACYDKCLAYSYYQLVRGNTCIMARGSTCEPASYEISPYTLSLLEGRKPPADTVNTSTSEDVVSEREEYCALIISMGAEIYDAFMDKVPVKLVQACLQNKVAAFLALQEYDHAQETITQAFAFIKNIPRLEPDPKLLYRAAIVNCELHHYEEALAHINEYKRVKPDDPLGTSKLKEIQQNIKEANMKEQKKYKKAFG